MMRFKIVSLFLIAGIGLTLSAQDIKSRSEFFKEFYGTYLKPLDIEVDVSADTVSGTAVDLGSVIKQ